MSERQAALTSITLVNLPPPPDGCVWMLSRLLARPGRHSRGKPTQAHTLERVAMGFGDKSKKEVAAEKAAAAAAAADREKEDASWAEGGKKGNKKKEAEEERKAAKAERKAAADEQAAEEDAAMSKPKAKDKKGGSAPKMSRAEIAAKAMAKLKEKEKEDKKKKKEIEESGGNEYMGALMENDNKKEGIDASGIDDAISALSMGEGSGAGKKVNMKAAFKEFEEREIARLKEENPGLKLSQLKERAFQAWQKSPENPQNQAVDVS